MCARAGKISRSVRAARPASKRLEDSSNPESSRARASRASPLNPVGLQLGEAVEIAERPAAQVLPSTLTLNASGDAEAMRRAAPLRMRSVLMTAISMIFGVLPAVVSTSISKSRGPQQKQRWTENSSPNRSQRGTWPGHGVP